MKVSGCPGNGLPFAALSHPDKSRIVGEQNEAMQRALTFSLSADTLIDGILHSRESHPCPSHSYTHTPIYPYTQASSHTDSLFRGIHMGPQGSLLYMVSN